MIAHQRAKLCCWGQYCILGFHCSSSLAVFLLCTKSTCVKTINWLVPERNFRNYFSTWQKSATRLFYFGLKDYFQNFRQNNINVHPFQPRELFESRKGVSFDSVFWIFSLHFLHFRFSFLFFFTIKAHTTNSLPNPALGANHVSGIFIKKRFCTAGFFFHLTNQDRHWPEPWCPSTWSVFAWVYSPRDPIERTSSCLFAFLPCSSFFTFFPSRFLTFQISSSCLSFSWAITPRA